MIIIMITGCTTEKNREKEIQKKAEQECTQRNLKYEGIRILETASIAVCSQKSPTKIHYIPIP